MESRHFFLLVAMMAMGTIVIPSVYSAFASDHSFINEGGKSCLSCHSDIKKELDSSSHSTMECENCHIDPNLISSGSHGNVIIPKCINCHSNIIQSLDTDSHAPFISGANSSKLKKGENEACVSCHSDTNKAITFARPSFVEWDVRNNNGSWLIENLTLGDNKVVKTSTNLGNYGIHIISLDNGCINCHDDIRKAVAQGGHSNEQWKMKHDDSKYSDMNKYCRSCHKPDTGNIDGTEPYPAAPFNSDVHASMTVTCIDCHIHSDLIANINGGMRIAPFDSGSMGNIEISMSKQPYNVQSYLCIACKNTGNPNPVNDTLHFKVLTEPDIKISLIKIPIPVSIVAAPVPTEQPTALPTVSPTDTPTVSPTDTPTVSPTDTPTVSPTDTPTVSPTDTPTVSPTDTPTVSPTDTPTVEKPTVLPTDTDS